MQCFSENFFSLSCTHADISQSGGRLSISGPALALLIGHCCLFLSPFEHNTIVQLTILCKNYVVDSQQEDLAAIDANTERLDKRSAALLPEAASAI